jgi:hypothetical protein
MKTMIIQFILAGLSLCIALFFFWKAWQKKRKPLLVPGLLFFTVAAVLGVITAFQTAKKAYHKADEVLSDPRGVFVDYDHEHPDTRSNRKRFEDYLHVTINDSVKNVFCYADFLGADHTIQLAFTCDPATLQQIVSKNDLRKGSTGRLLMTTQTFHWWDEEMIERIQPFQYVEKDALHKYLWFDTTSHRAFYLEFSL